jgi:hypothetical protein
VVSSVWYGVVVCHVVCGCMVEPGVVVYVMGGVVQNTNYLV